MNYTEVPWEVCLDGISVYSPSAAVIVSVPDTHEMTKIRDYDELTANAKLISAAPEMLLVLRRVLSQEGLSDEIKRYINLAILKAEGK